MSKRIVLDWDREHAHGRITFRHREHITFYYPNKKDFTASFIVTPSKFFMLGEETYGWSLRAKERAWYYIIKGDVIKTLII